MQVLKEQEYILLWWYHLWTSNIPHPTCLTEVLPGYFALFGMGGDDGAEETAAQGPGHAQEGLQQEERRPPDSSRKGLLSLQK